MNNVDYKGESFLNRIYKDLHNDKEVMHTALPSDNKNEKVRKYLDRLETVEELAKNSDKNGIELLKQLFYRKYVIKEENIPESYFKQQEKLALERGFGHVEMNNYERRRQANLVIEDQKKSLDVWLDYFLGNDNVYPEWFKYYAFQGMLKLGSYNKEKGEFNRRTDKTTDIFINLDREALALVYDNLVDSLDGNNVDDLVLDKLLKGGSFSKLYLYFVRKLESSSKDLDSNEGIWIKYDQGSEPDELVKTLAGKGTGWCTAGMETARGQLTNGDFYIYYTKDRDGTFSQPRIAIRMNGHDEIGEVRGIASGQNLESDMEKVLDKKLDEFPGKEKYKKRVSDMNKLTELYNRWNDTHERLSKLEEEIGVIEEIKFDVDAPIDKEKAAKVSEALDLFGYLENGIFTIDELKFLYEVDGKIDGFGYSEDPRIEEILEDRNIKKDLSKVFGYKEEEISTNHRELGNGKIKCFVGDINAYDMYLDTFVFPEIVIGNVNISKWILEPIQPRIAKKIQNVTLPKIVYKDLIIYAEELENVVLPEKIYDSLRLSGTEKIKNVTFPKEVVGLLSISNLEYATDLVLPKKVGSCLSLSSLKSAKGVTLPEEVGSFLSLGSLKTVDGLVLPKKIGGALTLSALKNVDGLVFPKEIYGELDLRSLTSPTNKVILPEKVTGALHLDSLEDATYVVLPKEVGSVLYLGKLRRIYKEFVLPKGFDALDLSSLQYIQDKLVLPEEIDGFLSLDHLEDARRVVFPKKVGGSLKLPNLLYADGVRLPEIVGSSLVMSSITSIDGMIFPKYVFSCYLDSLKVLKNTVLPEEVCTTLDLSRLCEAYNVIFPKKLNRSLDLEYLEKAHDVVLPETIAGDGILYFNYLEDAHNLTLPKKVDEIDFGRLKSTKGLIIPEDFECPHAVGIYVKTKDLIKMSKKAEKEKIKINKRGYSTVVILSTLTTLVSFGIIVLGVFINR